MRERHTFQDGGYNPAWPLTTKGPPAATLVVGDGTGSGIAFTFDDITLATNSGFTATAVSDGHEWRGESESWIGAILALLADRAGLHAVVTVKPEVDGD